jgi:predicted Zn finger-like uncharacterized protein
MDLTTRCPQCGITFSASLQQLQLRKGYIRCVNCAHIFDGFDAVVSPVPPAQAPVSPPSVVRQRPAPSVDMPAATAPQPAADHTVPTDAPAPPSRAVDPFTISSGPTAGPHPARQDPVFRVGEPLSAKSTSEPMVGRPQAEPLREAQAGLPQIRRRDDAHAPQIYVEPRRPASAADEAGTPAFLDSDMATGRSPIRIVWAALLIIGLALLLAQLAYVYRAQIANQATFLRPVLERACVPLHCKVAYTRRIDSISIMSSSLRAGSAATPDGTGAASAAAAPSPDSMVLQLTLRNTYDKPQEWPTLVLDLTDFSGTLIVRKNLPPESYLTPDVQKQPFPAGSEASISVPIALNGLKINGYKLDKFFQ